MASSNKNITSQYTNGTANSLLGSASLHILASYYRPLIGALCSLKGFCALNKSKKFKLSLVALIVCIIGFQFSTPNINFYTNPFYLGSFIFAIALLVIAVNFTYPNCRKNQVALSLKQFRLPSNTCCNCGYSVGKNGSE